MHALIALMAMAGSLVGNNVPAKQPEWQKDYQAALQRCATVGKPVAVFVGSGNQGWNEVVREKELDPRLNELLNGKYVCVYLDVSTEAGKKLAAAFEIETKGLVISDKTGNLQAFHHAGELSRADLTRTLQRYAAADHTVSRTESISQAAPQTQIISGTQPVPNAPSYDANGTRIIYGTQPSTYSPSPVYSGGTRIVPAYSRGTANCST